MVIEPEVTLVKLPLEKLIVMFDPFDDVAYIPLKVAMPLLK